MKTLLKILLALVLLVLAAYAALWLIPARYLADAVHEHSPLTLSDVSGTLANGSATVEHPFLQNAIDAKWTLLPWQIRGTLDDSAFSISPSRSVSLKDPLTVAVQFPTPIGKVSTECTVQSLDAYLKDTTVLDSDTTCPSVQLLIPSPLDLAPPIRLGQVKLSTTTDGKFSLKTSGKVAESKGTGVYEITDKLKGEIDLTVKISDDPPLVVQLLMTRYNIAAGQSLRFSQGF
jgi:hypothetical protein